MANVLLADRTITVSELKRNPTVALNSARGRPVAIMNHNKPTHYALTASLYERVMEIAEDYFDNILADSRKDSVGIPVNLDDL